MAFYFSKLMKKDTALRWRHRAPSSNLFCPNKLFFKNCFKGGSGTG
jgi:hypothetical protein